MPSPENPLAKIAAELPAHLPRHLPAHLPANLPERFEKMLPGGLRNRLVQWGLGVLLTFGLSFVVKRMLAAREQKKRALAPRPVRRAAPPPQQYNFAPATAGPAIAPAHLSAEGAALPYPMLG